MIISMDIETIPNDKAEEYFESKSFEPDSRLKPATLENVPGIIRNLKNPELREHRTKEWLENRQKEITLSKMTKKAEAMQKAALTWYTGRIICIGLVEIDILKNEKKIDKVIYDEDEKQMLEEFLRITETYQPTYVGKSIKDFDMPYLKGRLMANNLPVIENYLSFVDIDDFFSHSKACAQRGKLSDYAFGLGLEGKLDGIDGSKVYELYQQGEIEKIKDYCYQDCKLVSQIYERYYYGN